MREEGQGHAGHARRRCSPAAASSARGRTGDNVNLAVGQGDLQATPLQLATAYSTVANGGRVVRPHLGQAVEDGQGRLVQQIRKPARRKVEFSDANQQAIMDGLRGAATDEDGTSADVFKGFPKDLPVYGKTGTAERAPNPDQSWYAAYVPHPTRPIVVVTTVERGGFGAETAAPAARLILAEWFDLSDRVLPRRLQPDAMSAKTTIQPASEPPPPLVPREWRLRLDPLLLLATARARRGVAGRAQRRDGERHPRRAALLRLPPGDLRRASAWC